MIEKFIQNFDEARRLIDLKLIVYQIFPPSSSSVQFKAFN